MRSFNSIISATLGFVLFCGFGCSLARSGTGCESGESNDRGFCVPRVVADAGLDATVEMPDAESDATVADAGFDGDASDMLDAILILPDTGIDSDVDAGLIEVDAGDMLDAGTDAGPPPVDAGTDSGPPDAGPPGSVLRIVMHGATPATEGIAFRVTWFSGGPQDTGWLFNRCWGGVTALDADSIECLATDPALISGRTFWFFPFDPSDMSSRCSASSCPGTFEVTFGGLPVGLIVTDPGSYDQNHDGTSAGNTATLTGMETLPFP